MTGERHVSIDIETLGKGSRAAVASIGACEFFVGERFTVGEGREWLVDLRAGVGEIDADTVIWWLGREHAARHATFVDAGRVHPAEAIRELSGFVGLACAGVWGNGATFDNVIVCETAALLGLPRPWSHKLERDLRTLIWLDGGRTHRPKEVEPKHTALADAKWQAEYAVRMLRRLKCG